MLGIRQFLGGNILDFKKLMMLIKKTFLQTNEGTASSEELPGGMEASIRRAH